MDIIEVFDALPNHMDGSKSAIDEGIITFERKQKLKAKRQKQTWKWIEGGDCKNESERQVDPS